MTVDIVEVDNVTVDIVEVDNVEVYIVGYAQYQ
jgi:hypothetical protein